MIFVDTGAWVALEDKRDINHSRAMQFKTELIANKKRLVTTNYILDETLTLMSINIGYLKTVQFKNRIDQLLENNLLILLQVFPDIQNDAWNIFLKFNKDKKWSFTDCTSKAIMDKLNIYEVFTFDHHFEQMGFSKKP